MMGNGGKLFEVRMCETNPKWVKAIRREYPLYSKENDVRSKFERDYNRILHSTAYRRLKHKTQVFFATRNDHICTRIEHVNHVTSVSRTISSSLGINTELTEAIAVGHDLGHAPFGHEGEKILNELALKYLGERFWHEKNSLRFVDLLETLPDPKGFENNLNLTYAVRDGIICHCGEVDDKALFPRSEPIDLDRVEDPGQYAPFTWEGCVVKVADKIAFLGRDIEDALNLKLFPLTRLKELSKCLKTKGLDQIREINNTTLIHKFVVDLCRNSSVESGIRLSEGILEVINVLRDFSRHEIYEHPRLDAFKKYAAVIINTIFSTLDSLYEEKNTLEALTRQEEVYPLLINLFKEWLVKYSDITPKRNSGRKLANRKVYQLREQSEYRRSILDYISGMTDSFAIKMFNEQTSF